MNFKILTIPPFDKEYKKLNKKYPSLKNEVINLVKELKDNPVIGTSLGNNCYKIRLSIASKGKGKSGGARIITFVAVQDTSVYLLSIYDKSQQSDIDHNDLLKLLNSVR